MTSSLPNPNLSLLNGGNLLNNKWIDRFLRSRWYPGIIQWPTLLIFMVIMFELILGRESRWKVVGKHYGADRNL
jgi:hypothetical protein